MPARVDASQLFDLDRTAALGDLADYIPSEVEAKHHIQPSVRDQFDELLARVQQAHLAAAIEVRALESCCAVPSARGGACPECAPPRPDRIERRTTSSPCISPTRSGGAQTGASTWRPCPSMALRSASRRRARGRSLFATSGASQSSATIASRSFHGNGRSSADTRLEFCSCQERLACGEEGDQRRERVRDAMRATSTQPAAVCAVASSCAGACWLAWRRGTGMEGRREEQEGEGGSGLAVGEELSSSDGWAEQEQG